MQRVTPPQKWVARGSVSPIVHGTGERWMGLVCAKGCADSEGERECRTRGRVWAGVNRGQRG